MSERSDEFIDRVRVTGDPVADADAQVRLGHARFTVLTSRLLRLEYSPEGNFEDRASYAFPNRRADVPDFTVREDHGATIVDTGALVLRYQPDGRPFHEGNLRVALRDGIRWFPGLRDRHNLGGARRTVDTCRGDARLEPGLVSRSGWALHDDGASMLFESDGWAVGRARTTNLDWYFFGYGHDYAAAVSDYTRFGGQVPLLPRWMLGAWWSRYWAYHESDLRQLVDDFGAHDLPLDVLVIDMDWHLPGSWTGYSWNRELFPDPRDFLDWLHARGLHTTLNLHPALGVQPFETAYPDFVDAMGLDPASADPVPFHVSDQEYMRHYFELLHHPLEDEGVDFWWMDWQQGRTSESSGIDPLPWLNHLHFMDLARRRGVRRITFSRWGGLGSHRYPIGFSGDSFALWSALQFQPRYTAAGANVGYGWWSHDIGGHVGADDPELYVRWVQFGALSPILRLHSNQHPESERRPWLFGDEALTEARAAFRLRYQLMPYLYTAARVAADTGIAPVRPMSWIAPDDDNAYAARYQYLLGDAMVAAPIVHPVDATTGLATTDVWLPRGDWVERTSGERVTGPRWVRQLADLHRVPQFVRAGTVLPLAKVAPTTGAQPADHLILSVFPGASGSARVYDDDGTSRAFEDGVYCWTPVRAEWPDPSRCAVVVEPGAGDGACGYTVRLEHTRMPSAVTVDGTPHDDWQYRDGATIIDVPARPRTHGAVVEVSAHGPLSALRPDHDADVRAADVRRLLGEPSDDVEKAVLALPVDHPARAAAIARIGGPLLRVFEYTAPDEAADVLGRVVVAGESVSAEATWRLERGTEVQTARTGPVAVGVDGIVLDAPFRWDDSRSPARWSVDVSATWGDVIVSERHESAVLMPSLSSWQVRVDEVETAPSVDAVSRAGGWRVFEPDPFDDDYADLTQHYGLPLQHDAGLLPESGYVVHAMTHIDVASEGEVALEYYNSDDVEIYVDGQQLRADVTGSTPTRFYDSHPTPRRTEPVLLRTGEHIVLIRCLKAAELPWHEWCLSVSVVNAQDGAVRLDITSDAC